MNYSAVKYILSYVLMIEGALLLFPFIVGVLYMEQKSVWYLLVAVICIVLGVLGTRHKPKNTMFILRKAVWQQPPVGSHSVFSVLSH